MKHLILIILLWSSTLLTQAQRPKVCRDIQYAEIDSVESKWHQLDVYYPGDNSALKPVLIFIHGGSWESGKKETYRLLGKNMAKSGVVTVIINYRLTEVAMIQDMVHDSEKALEWTLANIKNYGGDPDQITVSGHSAGGHLAAMISVGKLSNSVSAIMLIDAFGLDMITYFQNYDTKFSRGLYNTFSEDPEVWKAYSPVYQLSENLKTPFLILEGERTYPAIKQGDQAMYKSLQLHEIPVSMHVSDRKKHAPMITQFFLGSNSIYGVVLPFIKGEVEQ
ncbi:MAG: alpha/beta hydrolase [Cyclobacteriaceae bacterium]